MIGHPLTVSFSLFSGRLKCDSLFSSSSVHISAQDKNWGITSVAAISLSVHASIFQLGKMKNVIMKCCIIYVVKKSIAHVSINTKCSNDLFWLYLRKPIKQNEIEESNKNRGCSCNAIFLSAVFTYSMLTLDNS